MSWHYRRVCTSCLKMWDALHCQHDRIQNPCPWCGIVPKVDAETECECEFDEDDRPIQGPPEEIGTGLYRLADGEIVGNEPEGEQW